MLKCPKCHAIIKEAAQNCRCGFDFMRNSMVLLSPLGMPAIYKIESHIKILAPKIVRGMEIAYPNQVRYVGDVKAGRRHGVGELFLADGSSNEGVWIDDVYSEKLSSLRKTFLLNKKEFGDDFWDAFGLKALPPEAKERISQKISEELSILVGSRVGLGLSDKQLLQFEELDNTNDEIVWLVQNCPDYSDIVHETSKDFLDTIIRDHVHGTGCFLPQGENPNDACVSESEDLFYDAADWEVVRKEAEGGYAPAQRELGKLYLCGAEALQIEADSSKAAAWLLLSAGQGDAESQYLVGKMFFGGKGVAQSNSDAIKWYHRAANQGFAAAQSALGTIFLEGIGVRQSKKNALSWFRLAAEQGDMDAQYNVGKMYEDGDVLAKDFQRAARWYRLAAEQGHMEAQYNLGLLYQNGNGVNKKPASSIKWLRRAAGQGHVTAQFTLALVYAYGVDGEQDDAETAKWLRTLAEQGHTEAQLFLGTFYRDGKGVARSYTEALKWFHLAAQNGNVSAQYEIGCMYRDGKGVAANPEEAKRWFHKAADQGDQSARKCLMDMQNEEAPPPPTKIEILRSKAEQGDVSAQYELGCMLVNSKSRRSCEEAKKWLSRAAQQGNENARLRLIEVQRMLADMYRYGR